jgi:hypothetical protein
MESPIFFDPEGDLRLVVSDKLDPEKQLEYVVCSKSLSRASPVFKSMLYGGFQESMGALSTARNWIVQLPEDNPAPMKILLYIIHSQYEGVPTRVGLNELYSILICCEKYQMIRIIRPWVKSWFEPHTQLAKFSGNEFLLWFGWQLGKEDVFRDVAQRLCVQCDVNSEGKLLDVNGKPLEEYEFLGPPGILGRQPNWLEIDFQLF